VLTGIVTTDEVVVGSQIQGLLQTLKVREGDVVHEGELLGTIQPQEWQADLAYFSQSERQAGAQITQAEADLRFQEAQTAAQIRVAEADFAAARAQVVEAQADLENARITYRRAAELHKENTNSAQEFDQARTSRDSAAAHVDALSRQRDAAEASLAMAKAGADQIAVRRAALQGARNQAAAAAAEKDKAQVHLGYTAIVSPIAGLVDVRAARQGEVLTAGQAVVALINPDDLWVRVDVEESLIDGIRIGDTATVRLPSGAERSGTVIFRGVDADYATQRDVSRTKRDIKTFEIRIRCDNKDRALAVGMTAYAILSPRMR